MYKYSGHVVVTKISSTLLFYGCEFVYVTSLNDVVVLFLLKLL